MVCRAILLSHKCKTPARPPLPDLRRSFLAFPCALPFPLLFALPPQQFPVNLGDFFQVIFDLVVVLDPAPDLV